MKKRYQVIFKGLVLLLITVLSSCSLDIDKATLVKDVFFPKRPPPVSRHGYMFREAMISGMLELKNNCLGFEGVDGSFITLIEWPNYFYLVRLDGVVNIIRNGKGTAKIGDYISMGGAGSGLRPGTNTQCLPPYWAVGAFSKPSFVEGITIRYSIYKRNKLWLKRQEKKLLVTK
ncbi:MAG: hypothetical protein ACKE51_09475 [Methylococcaceae bacterium]